VPYTQVVDLCEFAKDIEKLAFASNNNIGTPSLSKTRQKENRVAHNINGIPW
jgi:hypothetical protein